MSYTKLTNVFGEDYLEWDDNGTIRFVPCDESNSDYQAYLTWKAEQTN